MLLGCNVRVGKEDSVYRYPVSDANIVSNRETVEGAVAMARLLGKEPMTAAQYREMTGMKPM
jgi:uncharacterized protein (DUF849 family)